MSDYAVILAAGIGSRLHPLTENYPKSLVKVNGKEILSYQIDGYIKSGISEENIFIVTGYRHEMISEYLRTNYPSANEIYSSDYLSTNNMFSLYLALKETENLNFDSLFINNADCLYDSSLMHDFINCRFENAIAVEKGTYIEESMKVIQSQGGGHKLLGISKGIEEKDAFGVSIDLYKYNRKTVTKLYEIIKDFVEVKKELKLWTEVAFPELFKTENVYPFDINHKKWVEVDNYEDLAIADKLFSDFDITKKKTLICDMDGTLYVGSSPITSAVNWVNNSTNFDFYFLTNNTSTTPSEYEIKFKQIGIKNNTKNILTPLYPLIDYIKEKNFKSVYLVATEKVKAFLSKNLPGLKFDFNEKENQAVVLTYDTEINYEKLKNISILLNNSDAEYLATHSDVFCPTEKGPVPDIGSYIELQKVAVKRIPDRIFGKPNLEITRDLLKKYSKEEIAVIGDRLYTDKALADNIGCDFVLVLSGETKRTDVQEYNGKTPAIIVNDLGDLNTVSHGLTIVNGGGGQNSIVSTFRPSLVA